MGSTNHDKPGYSHFTIPSFKFTSGDVLDVTLVYKELNSSSSKKALIPTCFGGLIETTCTYSESPSSALSDHHVVVVAMMGNAESTSPSNTPSFPKSLVYQDNINAQYALTQHLGFKELDVVLGFSMGGQQAYHWAAMYPDFVKHSVCICGSARTSAHNYAFLEGPIAALTRSSDFGVQGVKPVKGIRGFWRAYIAWLFSAAWYRQGLWKQAASASTMAEFMDKIEDSLINWAAEDLLILARQWQAGDVGLVGGGYEQTLKGIKARMLVMPCKTDQYFPPEDSEIEFSHLKNAELAVIPSVWGHAAGGSGNPDDVAWVDNRLKVFLAGSL